MDAYCLLTATNLTPSLSSLHPKGTEGYHFPDASSVFITTTLVSFFPSLDAASSMKKSIERCGGTIIGAAAAIAIGFLSLLFGRIDRTGCVLGSCHECIVLCCAILFLQNKGIRIWTSPRIRLVRLDCLDLLQYLAVSSDLAFGG